HTDWLTMRHAPAPTLSPYTALFRSRISEVDQQIDREIDEGGQKDHALNDRIVARQHGVDREPADARQIEHALGDDDAGDQQREADRKSTRLNSSHVKSSYAVFCLKK